MLQKMLDLGLLTTSLSSMPTRGKLDEGSDAIFGGRSQPLSLSRSSGPKAG